MSAGRLWRTVRHLSAEQWIHRALIRGRMAAIRRAPGRYRSRIAAEAARLPLPDPSRPALRDIAAIALRLQTAIHGVSYSGAPDGRFRLLNRDFDFGSIEDIRWRGDFGEGANPLRRMVLAYMGYVVPLLATGTADSLSATVRLVRGLDAQSPWSAPGVLRDVWNAYTASHRLINLLAGLALYRKAGGPADDAAEKEILEHVRLCAAFVRRNLERDIQYNHLMKNLVALAVYAAACGAMPPQFAFLRRAVPKALAQNVLGDGGPAERSPMYHALALLDVRMLAASGLFPDDALPGQDRRMTQALGVMAHGDGEIALLNDSWIGEAPSAAALGAVPADGASRLPQTGYVRLAGSGDSAGDDVVFDCGPCGPDDQPGHAHADFLSVETCVQGNRFLVDTGVPTYTSGDLRNSSRAAAAHNGPRLEGAEPIEFWKSFRVGRRGYAGALNESAFSGIAPLIPPLIAAGWQDGYAHLGMDVRRLVALWPGAGLLIADLWRGGGHMPSTDFLVDGTWRIDEDGRFARNGTEISVAALAGALSLPEPDSCWRRFEVERPAHRLRLRPAPAGNGAQGAVWFGWADMPPPDAALLGDLFERLAAAKKIPSGE